MNNSKLSIDNVGLEIKPEVDKTPWLRQREESLLETIDAIQKISSSSYWKILKNNIFDGLSESLKKSLANEKDEKEIYRLQGQLIWAMKFADFGELVEVYKKELTNIRKQING